MSVAILAQDVQVVMFAAFGLGGGDPPVGGEDVLAPLAPPAPVALPNHGPGVVAGRGHPRGVLHTDASRMKIKLSLARGRAVTAVTQLSKKMCTWASDMVKKHIWICQ